MEIFIIFALKSHYNGIYPYRASYKGAAAKPVDHAAAPGRAGGHKREYPI